MNYWNSFFKWIEENQCGWYKQGEGAWYIKFIFILCLHCHHCFLSKFKKVWTVLRHFQEFKWLDLFESVGILRSPYFQFLTSYTSTSSKKFSVFFSTFPVKHIVAHKMYDKLVGLLYNNINIIHCKVQVAIYNRSAQDVWNIRDICQVYEVWLWMQSTIFLANNIQ